MLFDSHAHIDDKRFNNDRASVINAAKENGVTGIINIGADMASSARAVALAEKYDCVWATVGIHPHDAKDAQEQDYEQMASWVTEQPKVVAIGEIGLDYYYNLSPKEIQREVFIRHIDLARQLQKPIVIHDRDAHGDIMQIVQKECQGMTGVFHCFSGSLEMAQQVIKLGFYISIAGPLTFEKSVKLKEIAANVPLNSLFVETDSPYLTPHPYRGRRNEPAYVRYVAEEVAKLRGISLEEVAAATTANVRRLFGIV